ncbi:hypothetical protein [Streptomyces sp. NPDC020489]|uniref:hypothetical protein n=1 Tax=Streptomyces sp. NPDC020489 TaxID=3365077 RepID=UPI0037A8D488
MAVDQLPGRVREFANYLNGLLARLDQGGGWCAVFWQRDPDGMRACLEGREMPPWDVVEALLQDLATEHGVSEVAAEAGRARALHTEALAAFDARPGGRDALGDRLDVMLREQRYAAERQAQLGHALAAATSGEEADALRLDLAWARDDHERATARCAELRSRMRQLDDRSVEGQARAIQRGRSGGVFRIESAYGPGDAGDAAAAEDAPGADASGGAGRGDGWSPSVPQQRDTRAAAEAAAWREDTGRDDTRTGHAGPGGPVGPGGVTAAGEPAGSAGAAEGAGWAGPARADAPEWAVTRGYSPADAASPADEDGPQPGAGPAPAPEPPKQRKRRRGSARFAGGATQEAAPDVVPPAVMPTLPAPAARTRRTPRGARFAGAAEPVEAGPRPQAEPVDAGAGQEVVRVVETLVRLRAQGRSGEAHALLVEAAHWPAARFPLLAGELQRAGLGHDWATLLWEAASLPAERLVAAADALVEAGRGADGEQILRQGVARPAEEIGAAVMALAAEGRRREVRALLDAYVRVRTPEEAARSAACGPGTLVPLLLEAARGVSEERHWDLVHALRVAGFSA